MVFKASFEPATLHEVVAAYQCVALELLRRPAYQECVSLRKDDLRPERGREPSQALKRLFGLYIEPPGIGRGGKGLRQHGC